MLELVIGESLDISGDFNGGLEQHAMDVTVNITGEIGLGTMTMNKCNGKLIFKNTYKHMFGRIQ